MAYQLAEVDETAVGRVWRKIRRRDLFGASAGANSFDGRRFVSRLFADNLRNWDLFDTQATAHPRSQRRPGNSSAILRN